MENSKKFWVLFQFPEKIVIFFVIINLYLQMLSRLVNNKTLKVAHIFPSIDVMFM